MGKDYYKTLGVEKNASQDEIKKAFRKLAHQHHPDKAGGNADKFKEVNEAYSVLSDEKKRAQYDQFGSAGPAGAGFNPNDFGFDFSGFQGGFNQGGVEFDLGDLFGDIFGGGSRQRTPRGSDIYVDLEIPFEDAVFGVERTITLNKTSICHECSGSGAKPGTKMKTCHTCAGKGKVTEIRRSIMGAFQTTRVCDTCRGSGKEPEEKCHVCRGSGVEKRVQEIKVKIPSGLDDGEMIRLTGAGEAVSGGNPGDLYIRVHVKKHPYFRKEGPNLITEINVKLSDALLGTTYNLRTLDGDIVLKVPEGVSFGEVLRVKGKGVPVSKSARGDIFVKVNIVMPKRLSKEAKKALEDLKKEGI